MSTFNVSSIVKRQPKPWTPPATDMPLILSPADLTLIGTRRGRQVYGHKLGELVEVPGQFTDGNVPNAPVVRLDDVDGQPRYQVFTAHPPGWLAAQVTPDRGAPKPKRAKVLDQLAGIGKRPETIVPPTTRDSAEWVDMPSVGGSYVPGRAAVQGPAELLRWLSKRGVEVTLTPGGKLLVRAVGGHLLDKNFGYIRTAERLIVAELSGVSVACELDHDKEKVPPPAVTILALDVAACAACAEHAR